MTRGQELGLTAFSPVIAGLFGTRCRLYLGRGVKAFEHAYQDSLQGQPPNEVLCLIMAYLNRVTDVGEILERRVVARRGIGSVDDKTSASSDIILLEAAVLVGHRQSAELLLNRLAGSGFHTTKLHTTCTARHLGAAAALLGRPEEARNHYQEAIKVCTNMRFRPELALTRLQLAELLLEHYPDKKKEALEHLEFAINEFREMKMQPSLERALRHKEILGA
jgi:tetratricopeptide (TPR) repeat protein